MSSRCGLLALSAIAACTTSASGPPRSEGSESALSRDQGQPAGTCTPELAARGIMGTCDPLLETVVKWCDRGRMYTYDCAREDLTCGAIAAGPHDGWDDCLPRCEDAPDYAYCASDTVRFSCEAGVIFPYDCRKEGKVCLNGACAVPPPTTAGCGVVPSSGTCDPGRTIRTWCQQGVVQSEDCGQSDLICVWTAATGASCMYQCISGDLLDRTLVCNGYENCPDFDDEWVCRPPP